MEYCKSHTNPCSIGNRSIRNKLFDDGTYRVHGLHLPFGTDSLTIQQSTISSHVCNTLNLSGLRGMTSKTLTGSHGRMVQLDGLRAFAFVLVTLHHGGLSIPWLDLGTAGVSIFFVLSGMLITGILLDNRQSCADGPFARLWVVRQFFLRRILRLSPLLCTVLCISVLVNLPPFRASWPWHFFSLSNIFQFIYGTAMDQIYGRSQLKSSFIFFGRGSFCLCRHEFLFGF